MLFYQKICLFLQKLLVPEKYEIKRISRDATRPSSSPGGGIRVQLGHININCHEKDTGYTPLMIAVLNGKSIFMYVFVCLFMVFNVSYLWGTLNYNDTNKIVKFVIISTLKQNVCLLPSRIFIRERI